jgi:hypothetical protein
MKIEKQYSIGNGKFAKYGSAFAACKPLIVYLFMKSGGIIVSGL